MTEQNQKQLGKILWAIADQLRGAMDADDFRDYIRDRAALELNFRQKFETLNRVKLTHGEFQRLLHEIVGPDAYAASRILRERNSFTRDDGTPLNYTLVNIKDWCKNSFEVVSQLRINTNNSIRRR